MKNNSAYISYLPALIRCVEMTTGPILELGMGYSTMILHNMAESTKRKIVSYENDPKWYVENLDYKSDFHQIRLVNEWENIDIEDKYWSVVLVDHRPAFRRRDEAMRVKDTADYVIIHDSQPEINRFYGYTKIYPHFKYVYHYTNTSPQTTILSNFRDPAKLWSTI